MFVKNRRLGISGFLDLAALPIRMLLNRNDRTESSNNDTRKLTLLKAAPDGVSKEEPVVGGYADACEARAIRMIQDGERIVVEGFPLEQVAELCFKYNYRWRFHHGSKNPLRFTLEPGMRPAAPTKDSRP